MYKLAARSNCSFKTVQVAKWLPNSIVPFFLWKALEKKCTFFRFLSTVHAKVANSNPTNYIFLRLAINTLRLSIKHIRSPFFQNFKIGLECLIIRSLGHILAYREMALFNLFTDSFNGAWKPYCYPTEVATPASTYLLVPNYILWFCHFMSQVMM